MTTYKIPGGAQGGLTLEKLRQIMENIGNEHDCFIYLYVEEDGLVSSVREIEIDNNSIIFKGRGTS